MMNTCCLLSKIILKFNEMASIEIMIGGALINATTFVGRSYLAKYLRGDQNSVKEEKRRHDLAMEKYYRLRFETLQLGA